MLYGDKTVIHNLALSLFQKKLRQHDANNFFEESNGELEVLENIYNVSNINEIVRLT